MKSEYNFIPWENGRSLSVEVSVIVPLYNKENFIGRAIDSILKQTFEDFELIIVDDGSTDGSLDIIRRYTDPRIKILRQENRGPGSARNRGVEIARGELVAFLDADDAWHADYLKEGVRILKREGESVSAVCAGYVEYPLGRSREEMWKRRGIRDGVLEISPKTSPGFVVNALAYMSSWSTIVRRKVFQELGGFYDKYRCTYGEDAYFWLKVLFSKQVYFNTRPLVDFHRDASELSTIAAIRNRKLEPFVRNPQEIRRFCRRELLPLFEQVIALRTVKAACVLAYAGRWQKAVCLLRKKNLKRADRLGY